MTIKLTELFFPDGSSFVVAPGSQSDLEFRASDELISLPILEKANAVANVRNPYKCVDYNGLAIDFGMEPYVGGDLEEFRTRLASYVYTPERTGSDDDIESVLSEFGFPDAVYVKNNYLDDPRPYTSYTDNLICGNIDAYVGSENDFISDASGTVSDEYEILVNGDVKNINGDRIEYYVGNDSNYWGYVDFVCGAVVFNPDGTILSMEPLRVDRSKQATFKRAILRTKPIHTWVVLVVEYFDSSIIAQTGDSEIPIIAQTGDSEIPIIAQTGV